MKKIQRHELLACTLGIVIGALSVYQILPTSNHHDHAGHIHGDSHQITQPDEEYHVHADFLIYVRDERVDLSKDELMTTNEQELHEHVHLHDGNGEMLHIHRAGITFAEFLQSIQIGLTEECLTVSDTEYCTTETEQIGLYVNYEPYTGNPTEYEPVDDDAILLYYGEYDPEKITTYMNEIKDDACYYSGTCPERGVAPPESCGLTCEL